jgi:hypothetical protein
MAIALQLLRWPQQQCWMLKLDHAAGTTGLAVLDPGAMQVGFGVAAELLCRAFGCDRSADAAVPYTTESMGLCSLRKTTNNS